MSKFKHFNLDEAKQAFPLVNEETLDMLKGGCDECEYWKENGIPFCTVEEYEALAAKNQWIGGNVCGMGYVLGEVDCTGESNSGKYNDYIFCNMHDTYFDVVDGCQQCYYENHYDYNEFGDGNTDPGSPSNPDWNTGNNPQGGSGSHPGSDSSDFPITNFNTLYSLTSTLSEKDKTTLKSALDQIYDNAWGKKLCNLLKDYNSSLKFEIGETTKVDGVYAQAEYKPATKSIRFNTSDDIQYAFVAEELIHSVQDNIHGSNFKDEHSNFEFEAKVLVDFISSMHYNEENFNSDDSSKAYSSFIKKIEQGTYYQGKKFNETEFLNDFYNSCDNWRPKNYKGTCDETITPELLLDYAKSIKPKL